jgi:homoserine kinase
MTIPKDDRPKMTDQIRVRVPASSANLGPGFDALGLALQIYLDCRFRKADALTISATGRDLSSIPLDDGNLIWQTALQVAAAHDREMPPVEIQIDNDIPVGKGLGSSAAALLAGVVIANQILELKWGRDRILDEAARLEGHPDNVAASVLGSVVTAAIDADGLTRAIRLDLPLTLRVAIVCPTFKLATHHMRTVLPETYSKEDAIFNVQRAALLVAALATGNREAFPECFQDRLHQPYRLSLIPGMETILKLRAPGLLGCTLSGAGPAMLVFYDEGSESVVEMVRDQFKRAGRPSDVIFTEVDREGLKIECPEVE